MPHVRGALLLVLAASLAGAAFAFCAGEPAPPEPGRSIDYSP